MHNGFCILVHACIFRSLDDTPLPHILAERSDPNGELTLKSIMLGFTQVLNRWFRTVDAWSVISLGSMNRVSTRSRHSPRSTAARMAATWFIVHLASLSVFLPPEREASQTLKSWSSVSENCKQYNLCCSSAQFAEIEVFQYNVKFHAYLCLQAV